MGSRTVIVTDQRVGGLYATPLENWLREHGMTVHTVTVASGEVAKTRQVKAEIEDQLFALGCGRDTILIALGGGVVTDLTGFVAATYCRGVPVIYIPTSLLAMVDAAIGGKTGINTAWGKNTLGTFTDPHALFLDVSVLSTLPEKEYGAGFVEMIKHGLVWDADYAKQVMQVCDRSVVWPLPHTTLLPLILHSVRLKTAIVQQDRMESGLRALLNFGHSMGHAIEVASQYTVGHGMAVAWGMVGESWLSWQQGRLSETDFLCIKRYLLGLLMRLYGMSDNTPVSQACAQRGRLATSCTLAACMQALQYDKKNRKGALRMVLLDAMGCAAWKPGCYTQGVAVHAVTQAFDLLFSHTLSC